MFIGKGSVSSMVESILRKSGLKTGLYTSPHLVDVRERIRVNGELLSETKFEKYCKYVWDKLDHDLDKVLLLLLLLLFRVNEEVTSLYAFDVVILIYVCVYEFRCLYSS